MIRLIVAIDRKRGIAKHGYQPWYIPDDEAYFIRQSKSYGGNVLVGGTTFRDSFKSKPLSERTTYLLTRDEHPIDGVQSVHDLSTWLTSLKDQDIWVVGGASVYTQVIDAGLADELYITHIDADFGCDQFFPEYESKFHLSSQNEPSEQNGFHFTYARYTRT
jgi:dihydrofolate reductase